MSPPHQARITADNPGSSDRVGNSDRLRRAVIDRRAEFVEQQRTHSDPTYDAVIRLLTKPSTMKIVSVDENEQPTAIHLDRELAAGLIDYLAIHAITRPTRSGKAWRAFHNENNPGAVEKFGDSDNTGAHIQTNL